MPAKPVTEQVEKINMKEITILGSSLKVKECTDEHAPGDRRHCVIVKGEMRSPSDGYHTFDELYEQRHALFIALCHVLNDADCPPYPRPWRSKFHSDGTAFNGWFVLGIGKNKGSQMTFHLPMSYWDETDDTETLEKAPEFDGHTSQDVIQRLLKI